MSLFGLDTDTILNLSIVLSSISLTICGTLLSLHVHDWMKSNAIRILVPHVLVLESGHNKKGWYEILHVAWTFLGLKVIDNWSLHTRTGNVHRVEGFATMKDAKEHLQVASL